MDCRQIDKYIYEFCDKQLSPHLYDQIQHHLNQCEYCRSKVESAREEGQLLRSLPVMPALSAQFTAGVMASIKQRHVHNRPRFLPGRCGLYPRKMHWWWGVGGTAVLLLALVSLSFLEIPLGSKSVDYNNIISMEGNALPAPAEPLQTAQAPIKPTDTAGEESAEKPPEEITETDPYQRTVLPTEASQRTVLPAEASQPTPVPQAVAHNFSAVAVSDRATKSVLISEPNRGAEPLTLHPTNLPPDYTLHSIISPSDQEITFVYENQITDQKLMLTIVRELAVNGEEAPSAEEPLLSRGVETPASKGGGTVGVASAQVYGQTANVKRVLDHNQQPYRVILTAEIDTAELTDIADAIILEEGIDRVQDAQP